jgi:sugar/nucleoside kinase (ribokinase family)
MDMCENILVALGYVGEDAVTRSTSEEAEEIFYSTGGALWHFLNGYSLERPGALGLAFTDVKTLRSIELRAPWIDWSRSVVLPACPRFNLRYEPDGEQLAEFSMNSVSIPVSQIDLSGIDAYRVHVCSMPWESMRDVIRIVSSLGISRISMQLHSETLPASYGDFEEILALCSLVFCNSSEFSTLQSRGLLSGRGSATTWMVSNRHEVLIHSSTDTVGVDVSVIEYPVDVTGAGDVLAGAFLSVYGGMATELALKHAIDVAALSISDYSSRELERILAKAWDVRLRLE